MAVERKTTFIGSSSGDLVRYQAPVIALNRNQRLAAYHDGIRLACSALKDLKFIPISESEHSVAMSYKGMLFDFRLQDPALVAHITSRRNHDPSKTHDAVTYRLKDEMQSEFCLQLIIGAEAHSEPPIYIPLNESLADPADFIYRTIFGFLTALSRKSHPIGDSVKGLSPEKKQIPDWIEVTIL